jgi:hypothetical protein
MKRPPTWRAPSTKEKSIRPIPGVSPASAFLGRNQSAGQKSSGQNREVEKPLVRVAPGQLIRARHRESQERSWPAR